MTIDPPEERNGDAGEPCRIVLVRYLPGLVEETARTVHLVTVPGFAEQAGATAGLCGMLFRPEEIEVVSPGAGAPCTLCALSLAVSAPRHPWPTPATSAAGTAATPQAAVAQYRSWDWPVTLRRDQIRLHLRQTPIALLLPTPLAAEVSTILVARHCAPAVLAHPYAPHHQVLLAGEKYTVTLPWPEDTHRVTGAVLLPPSPTPRGPIRWIRAPTPDTLHLTREIDVFAALRAALRLRS